MMQHGPLKRSDSVRSAATIHMGGGGSGGRAKENGMLRKSKTELIITPKKNVAVGEARESRVSKEIPKSHPSATGDLKRNMVEGEQSNCVVM